MDADRIVEQARRARANLEAFLMMIRVCEGTDAPNGYRYLFGSTPKHEKLFQSFAWHPNIRQSFRDANGKLSYTTAAGAFQIIFPTWSRAATALQLPDFGKESQDLAATWLIQQRGALDDVKLGRLSDALDKCGPEWASLPTARAPQPRRSFAFAYAAFAQAGGDSTGFA